jgi:hypothetical protein
MTIYSELAQIHDIRSLNVIVQDTQKFCDMGSAYLKVYKKISENSKERQSRYEETTISFMQGILSESKLRKQKLKSIDPFIHYQPKKKEDMWNEVVNKYKHKMV